VTRKQGKQTDLDRALDALMGRLDRKNDGAWTAARVTALWSEIAGPVVGAHTTGVHLRGGTLVVHVDSHARANDLAALGERYKTEMNSGLGRNLVSKVVFTVSKKVAEERRIEADEADLEEFYNEDDVEPVPLTATERAQIEASAAGIPDEALREAVVRATVRDLEWKRGIAARNAREKPRDGV
jgi:hypothetical protein